MDRIKQLVTDIVKKYNTRDPYELCDYLGIKIMECNLGKRAMGLHQNHNGVSVIHLNENIDNDCKKYVLAHEIGHLLLHKNANLLFMKGKTLFCESKLENQANKFAIEFLLEDDLLNDIAFKGMTFEQVAATLKMPLELFKFKFNNELMQ